MDEAGLRLDRFLSRKLGISRSQAQQWILDGRVLVEGKQPDRSAKLPLGAQLTVAPAPPTPSPTAPEHMPLDIVYEDADLLVIDKPPGLTVHTAPGHPSGTLVNALLARYPDLAALGGPRPGIVHRLDRDTSGLLVVVRTKTAQDGVQRQINARAMAKGYLALVVGRLSPEEGVIEAPLGRDPARRERMAVVSRGREAVTRYRVQRYLPGHTLVEVMPETGRTHQIRVHFAAIGHPLAGDRVYGQASARPREGGERGQASPLVPRQFLHAHRLGLRHPRSGELLEFTSPLPEDLREALLRLESGPAS